MKNQKRFLIPVLSLVIGLALAACTSGGGGGSGSVGATAAAAGQTFLYVSSFTENSIWVYSFLGGEVPQTNLMQTIPTGSSGPQLLLTHPSSRYLYTLNTNTPTITEFSVDPNNGQLSPIGNLTVANAAVQGAISGDGNYLYVTTFNGQLDGFQINQATGALTELLGFPLAPAGVTYSQLTISINSLYLLLTDATHGTLTEYAIGVGGVLSYDGALPGLTGANAIAVNAGGDVLLIAMLNGIETLTYDQIGGTVGAAAFNTLGFTPTSMLSDGVGRIFTESSSFDELNSWNVNSSTAVMSAISPYLQLGSLPSDLAVDPTNSYLAVAEAGTNGVRILNLDAAGNPGLAAFLSLPVNAAPTSARFIQIEP